VEQGTRQAVLSRLRNLEHLARFQAYPDPPARRDPWKGFDLTDTLLLTGRVEEGLDELRSAIQLTEPRDRESSLTSVIDPLRDYLAVDVLDEPTAQGVRTAIDLCEKTIGPPAQPPRSADRPARGLGALTRPAHCARWPPGNSITRDGANTGIIGRSPLCGPAEAGVCTRSTLRQIRLPGA
jgi:hypothetical protein